MDTATSEEKREWWGDGPWVDEVDSYEFEHSGIKCKILRVIKKYKNDEFPFGGHLCGYCTLPEGHPFHGLGYSDKVPGIKPDLTANAPRDKVSFGGIISLLSGDQERVNEWLCTIEGLIFVHGGITYAENGEIGFDCAHSFDLSPYERKLFKDLPDGIKFYRDLDFVINECKSLADQIIKYNGLSEPTKYSS